ncbi:dihydrofolate reductase [Azoarcus olearius]|uniref:Dihydrofolate reductase n=1 Tax=Azoarcus sp. (strain BH72) TaxID=418699 RepID=A1KAF8_AZOSB|nr:dihydrofolate reductase [Azoarcus olearius]CAL95814.1 FolA protein [Azoarcus olearius]
MTTPRSLTFVVAIASNGVIGRNNALPWRLKADLAHFKAVTLGHPIVMGRKTWESLGRPLPGRRNMVVTRNADYRAIGAEVFATPEAAVNAVAEGPLFVIGGAQLYKELLPMADRLLITEVLADVEGDAYFPPFNLDTFRECSREHHPADADNQFAFDIVDYRRR